MVWTVSASSGDCQCTSLLSFSLCRLLEQNKWQKFISHSSRKSKTKGPTWSLSNEDLLPGSELASFPASLCGRRSEVVPWGHLYKSPDPVIRASPSWPKHLPKAPLPNTIACGWDFNTWILGKYKHSDHGTWPQAQHTLTSELLSPAELPHTVGPWEICAHGVSWALCAEIVARSDGHVYCMYFLSSHTCSMVSLDFTYKTQVQWKNDWEFKMPTAQN